MKSKILIITYHFWPEQTPRAFRAFELAKEFTKRDCEVTVITKKTSIRRNIKEQYFLHEIPVRFGEPDYFIPPKLLNTKQIYKNENSNILHIKNIIKKLEFLHFWKYLFWPSVGNWEFAKIGNNYLKKKLKYNFDMTISIAYPLGSHLLATKLKKQNLKTGTLIADYGDPYTFNPDFKFSINNFIREKRLLSNFDHISIPISNAIEAFTKLGVNKNKIHIIPQGFSLYPPKIDTNIFPKNTEGKKILLYGGIFYKKIRNPEAFFDALILLKEKCEFNFICYIYTNLQDPYVLYLKNKYKKKLNNKLYFNNLLMREEFIIAAMLADYCVNFINKSKYQLPSKLIDYAIAGAKVLDIDMMMNPEEISIKIRNNEFYTPPILKKYDIKEVVTKFLALK